VKGGRFGVEINEEVDKDVAFVIGYVGPKSNIEFLNSNLSCVAKTEEFLTEAGGCSGSSRSSSGNSNGSCSKALEKRFAGDSVSMQLERKRKGLLEISDLVVRISWNTISRITKTKLCA
jgi:hypothetical protein